MKLICEGTMLAIVPWAYLHCKFSLLIAFPCIIYAPIFLFYL